MPQNFKSSSKKSSKNSRIAKIYLSIIFHFYCNKIIFLISYRPFWRNSIIPRKMDDNETQVETSKVNKSQVLYANKCPLLCLFMFSTIPRKDILFYVSCRKLNSVKTFYSDKKHQQQENKINFLSKSNLKSNSEDNFLKVLVKIEIRKV